MTAQRYVHDILQPHVLLLLQRFLGAFFQQGNARLYMARVSQDCLRIVATLPWPARSPELSQIEHIWDHLFEENWEEEVKRLGVHRKPLGWFWGRFYMWIETLLTAHMEQKNDLEIFVLPLREREHLESQSRGFYYHVTIWDFELRSSDEDEIRADTLQHPGQRAGPDNIHTTPKRRPKI
ncbi:transposable element Tcb1 transposase [Trichonephila clavipes]|nr:transposable element Tcb1 transposase [Trichonephila clavipes]